MPPRSKTSLRVFKPASSGTSYPAPAKTPSARSCNRPLGMAIRMSSIQIVDGEGEADGRGALAEAFVEIVVAAALRHLRARGAGIHAEAQTGVVTDVFDIVEVKGECGIAAQRLADRTKPGRGLGRERRHIVER